MSVFVASFDIGRENFAFCVEEVDFDSLLTLRDKIKVPPKTKWYDNNGEPTSEFQLVLDEVYASGEIREWMVHDIRDPSEPTELTNQVMVNLTSFLNEHNDLWDVCDMFLVEQQHKFNPKAIRVSHHCLSYFIDRYGVEKPVFTYSANLKYRVLGCKKKIDGKKITKYQRKKWGVVISKEIMKLRDDHEGEEQLSYHRSKADDLADTLIQLQAYKFQKWFEGGTPEVLQKRKKRKGKKKEKGEKNDMILNPQSGRWVKKTGKIGKQLLLKIESSK